ncbi:hypothetical protein ACTUVN_003745 [Pseudomonas caspiana]
MLHIMDAELIEGNYVLYQGDLSTNCVCCWEKLSCRVRDEPALEKNLRMPVTQARKRAYDIQQSSLA